MTTKSIVASHNQIISYNEIDCGIGNIEYKQPDNLLLQQLMEEFAAQIKKDTPSGVLLGLKSLDKEVVTNLEDEILELNDKVKELSDRVEEYENAEEGGFGSEIDCGIDVINYEEPGSIVLQSVMENLGEAILKHGASKIDQILNDLK